MATEEGATKYKYKNVKTESQPNGSVVTTDTSDNGNRVSVTLGLADGSTAMRNEYVYEDGKIQTISYKVNGVATAEERFRYTYQGGEVATIEDTTNGITIRYVPATEGQEAFIEVSDTTGALYSYETVKGDSEATLKTTIGSGEDATVYEYTYTKDDHGRTTGATYALNDGSTVSKSHTYSPTTMLPTGYVVTATAGEDTINLTTAVYTYMSVDAGETGYRSLIEQETLTGGINKVFTCVRRKFIPTSREPSVATR